MPILQGYGMTEASPGVYLAVAEGSADRPVSIGFPHFFTDVTLAPAVGGQEAGQAAGDGPRQGELLVRGLNMSRGYWNRPAEVEAQIIALRGVTDCALIGLPDPRWGEVGMAFVVLSGTHHWTETTLRDALRAQLAPFKIPKHVRFVDQLPRTVTGKVRKQDLRASTGKDTHADRR